MRAAATLLLLAAALFVGLPVAAAQEAPCDPVLANATNATAGPGDDLDAAIGSQRERLGTELNDRWFDARLENASTDEERAAIVAAEADRVDERATALGACLDARRTSPSDGQPALDLTDDEAAVLYRHALALHSRVNETRAAAADLPPELRSRHDLGSESLAPLEARVVELRERLAGAVEEKRLED